MTTLPRRQGLVWRTVLVVSAAVLGAGLLTTAVACPIARHWEITRQHEALETLLEAVTPVATTACFKGDAALGEQVVRGLASSKGMLAATLRDADTVLAQATFGNGPFPAKGAAVLTRKLWSPFSPQTQVGELTLYPGPWQPHWLGADSSPIMLGGLLTRTLLVALALAMALHLHLVLPLKALTARLRAAGSEPPLSLAVPLGHESDEIGQLTLAVNDLLARQRASLTLERQTIAQLGKEKRQIQAVLDHTAAGIFTLRGDGSLATWTPAFLRLLEFEHTLPQPGSPLGPLFGPGAAQVEHCFQMCQSDAAPAEAVFRLRDRRGGPSHRWLKLSLKPVGPDWIQGLLEDLTPRLAAGEAWEGLATQDPHTGFLNRLGAERAIADHFSNHEASLGLMLISLEPDLTVSDPLPPELALEAVREQARRLASRLQGLGQLARLEEREFLMLFQVEADPSRLLRLGTALVEALAAPMVLPGGLQAQFTAHAGLAVQDPEEEPSRQALLKRAGTALEQARGEGPNRCRLA